jgi:1,4-dihydroxy-6-naphthoate synthase
VIETVNIRVAHSPDSDDAFMFYALAADKLNTGRFRFSHILQDIETLNRCALAGEYEVTAVSIHAYAYISDKYALLPSGASMGDRYGPVVVSKSRIPEGDIKKRKIAIPGMMTSAYLALKLYEPDFEPVVMPFDQIMAAVHAGTVESGLLIHEGQLTYASEGLHKIVDLGEWWNDLTGLPLPLGGNAIRRNLGPEVIKAVSALLKESILYGLNHRSEGLQHALQYARDLSTAQADRFVGMYVNERTVDYGEDGRRAVQLFLDKASAASLIPQPVQVEFVD